MKGEIDIELDNMIIEAGVGVESKVKQARKYADEFPDLFNPNKKIIVFYLPNPKYGGATKRAEITSRGCLFIDNFEDFLKLF